MPRRNSPNAIEGLEDLSDLGELVYDKRTDQRASAKKNRRNRHYEKLFIRHAVARQLVPTATQADPLQNQPEQDP